MLRPLVAVLITAAFMGLRMLGDGIGLSSFVVAGGDFVDAESAPVELTIRDPGSGYDGQFFYRLSLDPFTSVQTDFGITLDEPGYRQQRIGLPLAAHALSQLTGVSTLVWLPVLSLAGVALLTAGAERLLASAGANRWWSVAAGVSPGVLVAARLDLAEPLALGLAVAGVALWARLPWASSLLLTGAALTRETTLALAGGVFVAAAWTWWIAVRQRGGVPLRETVHVLLATAPAMAVALWQVWLRDNWGSAVASSSAQRLGIPLVDVLRSLTAVRLPFEVPEFQQWGWWTLRVGLILVTLSGVVALRRSTMALEIKGGLILATAMVLLLGGLGTSQQSTRATVEAVTLSLLVLAATAHPIAQRLALLVPALAMWAFALTP